MKLYEFFSQQPFASPDAPKEEGYDVDPQEKKERLEDDLYWHIIDDDYLHKKHFMPIAREIKHKMKSEKYDHAEYIPRWMPMVKDACKYFYKVKEMHGDVTEIFDKNLRIRLCKRLAKQFQEDIKTDSYKLGI